MPLSLRPLHGRQASIRGGNLTIKLTPRNAIAAAFGLLFVAASGYVTRGLIQPAPSRAAAHEVRSPRVVASPQAPPATELPGGTGSATVLPPMPHMGQLGTVNIGLKRRGYDDGGDDGGEADR